MAETIPTWIYRADGEARIENIAPGEPAPEGWSFDIGVIEDETKRTADAVSGVKPAPEPIEPESPEAAVARLEARLAEHEAPLAAGPAEAAAEQIARLSAENERLKLAPPAQPAPGKAKK